MTEIVASTLGLFTFFVCRHHNWGLLLMENCANCENTLRGGRSDGSWATSRTRIQSRSCTRKTNATEALRTQRREMGDELECELDEDLGKEGRRDRDVEDKTA
jgi:hypothetical protein